MAVGIVDRQKLVNIADAVREKKGITGNMTLDAIASNITSITASDNNAKFDFAGSGSNSSGDLLSYLTTVDLSNFDTSNYTSMDNMFKGFTSVTSLDLSGFKTSNVTSMCYMFSNCSSLTTLDLSNFDTILVNDMGSMFNGCSSLKTLDLSKFDTSNVTSMNKMFDSCSSLTTLDLSNFDTIFVNDMNDMFYSCSSLTTLDLSGFKTSNVNDMGSMFNGCSSLKTLDLSNFDTSNVYNMGNMFTDCYSLETLDLSNWNTSNVADMYVMFSSCSSLKTLDLSNFDTSNVADIYYMFYNCSSLTSLNVSNFNTSNVTSMNKMFDSCSSLTNLDLSNWNTSKVTSMYYMFYNCSKLTNLTLGTDWASNSSLSSFDLSYSPLTRESALDVINKLATRNNSPVIKFSNAVGLYQSEIDVATNKGWSVSGCSVLVEDPSTATVGQYALVDGVVSKCVYVADTPQDWGQKIFASQSHITYSNGKGVFQWGGYGTATGITATAIGTGLTNTNALLAMNLQSTDGTPTIWDALKEFRSKYGDRWFIASLDESSLYIGYVYWTSSEVTSENAYTRNTSVTADSVNKTSTNSVYAFTYV